MKNMDQIYKFHRVKIVDKIVKIALQLFSIF